MSLTDPLLKDLKGHILEVMKLGEDVSIDDTHSSLLPMCQVLEEILRKGLQHNVHSAFGMTKRDYWSWIEKLDETSTGLENGFKRAVKAVSDNTSVLTSQGRGRLFIRHALQNKCLHVPIESNVRLKCNDGIYDISESIVGNEILGEILLSLLYQLGRLNFDLNVRNSSFLEETWQLPLYVEYELVPCLDLGICLGHVSGRSVVIRVEEGSVAGEDNKIEIGDVIHEAFGVCIHGWRKGKVTALLRQNRGLPVSLKVIKGHYSNGCIFPGVVPLLRRLQLDVDELQEQFKAALKSDNQDIKPLLHIGGQSVNYLGSVSVGNCGDVSRIEHAVSVVVNQARVPVAVRMITGEIGVQTLLETNRKVILSHSYTEISACGRRNDMPLYFAYIAGDTSCTISSHFTCYVFQAPTEDKSRDILLTLADGFHRTHWAV